MTRSCTIALLLLALWPAQAMAAQITVTETAPIEKAPAPVATPAPVKAQPAPAPAAAPAKPATAKIIKPKAKTAENPPQPEDADTKAKKEYDAIMLQGLNKVTGHISKLESLVGTVMRFGNLEIIARRCWKSSPEDQPENAALLEISELKPGEPPKRIFLGWMFSSSPGLSGLEHPVYDITVLDCEEPSAVDKSEPAAEPAKKEAEKKP